MAEVKTVQVEVWIVVDADGDYAVGNEEAQACERFEEEVAELESGPTRRVKVVLTVPVPTVIEVSAVIPAEPADATVSVS